MSFAYLLLFPMALSAFWINIRATEELTCILTAISGLVSLIFSLLLAPWFAKLLMLVVFLKLEEVFLRRLLPKRWFDYTAQKML
jgi:hypothetical protein